MTVPLPDPVSLTVSATQCSECIELDSENGDQVGIAGGQALSVGTGLVASPTSELSKIDWGEVETGLADIWTDVLGIPPESLDQSFFAAGGHSLTAVRFFVGIRDRFACDVPFRLLFASPTIREIAAYVSVGQAEGNSSTQVSDEDQSQGLDPIAAVTECKQVILYPASYPQRSLWTLDQVNEDLTAYNIPLAWRIDGPLDIEALRFAIEQVVESHEPLRTVFEQDSAGVWQRVMPSMRWELTQVDLRPLASEVRSEVALERMVDESLRPWDLREELPLRTTLYQLEEDSHLLLFVLHHIAVDGWSLHCLRAEVSNRYRSALQRGSSPVPVLRSRYAAFSSWQRRWMQSDGRLRDLAYWKKALEGLAPLDFPTDFPRPIKFSFRGQSIPFEIDHQRVVAIHDFCAEHQTTPHVFLLTVFQLALAVYADAEDVCCMVPITSRDRSEWDTLIGYFINSVAVRSQVRRENSFLELLAQVHRNSADAYDHSKLPFEAVVEGVQADVSQDRNPIAQTLFQLMDFSTSELQLEGTRVTEQEIAIDRVRFDLEMIFHAATDAISGERVLRGDLNYCTDLWAPQTMLAFLDYYLNLVDRCLRCPSESVQNCSLISEEMNRNLAALEKGPRAPELLKRSVMELIEESVARKPQSVALVHGTSTWSYQQMDARTEDLAIALIACGVRAGDRVAVLFERSVQSIVSLLAIWRVGAVYLPLDPQYPQERLVYFLEDAQPAVLLTSSTLQRKLPFSAGKTLLIDKLDTDKLDTDTLEIAKREIDKREIDKLEVDADNSDGVTVADRVEDASCWQYDPGRAAYLLYTSGSTGTPKGVEVPHRTLTNFIAWHLSHPRLGRSAVTLQFAPLSFDVSVQEIATTFVTCGTLVLIDEEVRQDPHAMLRHLREHGVQRLFLPFVMLDALAIAYQGSQEDKQDSSLAILDIISAGESLRLTSSIRHFVERNIDCVLHNHYGPTETHVITETMIAMGQFADGQEVPIGRPIPNCQTLILDQAKKRVARGAVGDLYLAGDALANGYWSRPELTAERFIEVSAESLGLVDDLGFPSKSRMRLYRSGDRARWRWDGALDFLGRLDDQVKFRGHRIELGEIAHRVGQLQGVKQAHVLVRKIGATSRLIAYVVLDRPEVDDATVDQSVLLRANLQNWRAALQRLLPNYMLPQDFVILREFPRTPSGKLDARNLPLPMIGEGADSKEGEGNPFVAPSTSTQVLLVALWQDLLGGDRVSVRSSFLDLGMHSLLAMRFASIIQKRVHELGSAKRVPVRWLFQFPTIELLANKLDVEGILEGVGISNELSGPLNSMEDNGRSLAARNPLSPSQKRLWFLDQLEGDTTHYHIHAAWKWSGECDFRSLRSALESLIARHDSLRTIYLQEAGVPYQIVREGSELDFQDFDVADWQSSFDEPNAEGGLCDLAHDWLLDRIQKKFDLEKETLLRASVLRLSAAEFIVSLVVHHIAADGQSMAILKQDLFRAYRAALLDGDSTRLGQVDLSAPTVSSIADPSRIAVQYLDYVKQKPNQKEVIDREIEYWREQLQDLPTLELPTDYRRPERLTYQGLNVRRWIDSVGVWKIEQVCKELQCSPNTLLLAGFKLLLARYARQHDIAVAVPVLGREHPQYDSVVGFFVNTVIVRTQLQDEDTLREWIGKVGRSAFDALEHRHVPFDQLVETLSPERRLNQAPWTSLSFQWLDQRVSFEEPEGVQIADYRLHSNKVRFDLEMHWFRGDQGLVAELHYATDLFSPSFAESFLEQYVRWIDAVVEDVNATTEQVQFLFREDENRICREWNAEGWRETAVGRVEEYFWKQVEHNPEGEALLWKAGGDNTQRWTYGELGAYANEIAEIFRRSELGTSSRVAVLLSRSPEYVASVLAILSIGCTYVPLDAKYPTERLALMLEDSESVGIVCDASRKGLASRLHQCCIEIPSGDSWLSVWRSPERQTDGTRGDPSSLGDRPNGEGRQRDGSMGVAGCSDSYARASSGSDVAYVMYTSGSTGKPKGVAIPHSGIVRLVIDPNYIRMDGSKRIAFLSSVAFDASTFEMWGALLNGAALAIAPEDELLDLQSLSHWMKESRITTAWLTVGLFNTWIDTYPEGLVGLSEILTGGEALSIPHVATAQKLLGEKVRLINGYGPTENTTFTTYYPVPSPLDTRRKSIPIGRPIRGTRIYVVDRKMRLVPPGVPGELLTGGDGLATGYLGDTKANQEKFITEHSIPGEGRLYRTGDLCRWLHDGTVEFLGRIDQQIKLRGFRIEPSEIQSTLEACSGVQRAYVHVVRSGVTAVRLEAYVIVGDVEGVSSDSQRQILSLVRQQLRERLPAYMIPERFYVVDQFPLNASGKIDARKLVQAVEFYASDDEENDRGAIDDSVTRDLRGIWLTLLRRGASSHRELHDNLSFFDAGGHSLLAIQLFHQIEKTFRVRLPLATIFRYGTIRLLAEQIRVAQRGEGSDSWVKRLRLTGQRTVEDVSARSTVYVFPGVGGELLFAGNLIKQYSDHFEWVGLQPKLDPRNSDDVPIDDFKRTATAFAKSILEHRRNSHDRVEAGFGLIGFSYGARRMHWLCWIQGPGLV
jgi:amino acid adenylation domain-containing protein